MFAEATVCPCTCFTITLRALSYHCYSLSIRTSFTDFPCYQIKKGNKLEDVLRDYDLLHDVNISKF